MRPHSIIRTLAAAALIAVPSLAMAAPDQNTQNPGQYNNCQNGQWVNGQCVYNNGQNNNGNWNNGRNRHRDRDNNNNNTNGRDRDDRNQNNGNYNNGRYGNNGGYNNGGYNNGGYNNGGYNNGGYNNGSNGNQLTGTVSSFSPYNLYLNNGLHVVLHNGTVISPTGSNLTPGQRVRVIGYRNNDGTFAANEIDVIGNSNGNRYGGNRYLR